MYLFHDGLVRMCTEVYVKPTKQNIQVTITTYPNLLHPNLPCPTLRYSTLTYPTLRLFLIILLRHSPQTNPIQNGTKRTAECVHASNQLCGQQTQFQFSTTHLEAIQRSR